MKRPNTHDIILDAAEELLDTDGLDAVTMRGLAERAHIGKSTIAHHFGSKNGLLEELYLRTSTRILRMIIDRGEDRAENDGDDARNRVHDPVATFIAEHPGLADLVRSSKSPVLDGDAAHTFKELLPVHLGEPHLANTMLLTALVSQYEFSATLSPSERARCDIAPMYRTILQTLEGR